MKLHYGDKVDIYFINGDDQKTLPLSTCNAGNKTIYNMTSADGTKILFSILPIGDTDLGVEFKNGGRCWLNTFQTINGVETSSGKVYVNDNGNLELDHENGTEFIINNGSGSGETLVYESVLYIYSAGADGSNNNSVYVRPLSDETCGNIVGITEIPAGRNQFTFNAVIPYGEDVSGKFILPLGIAVFTLVFIGALIWMYYQFIGRPCGTQIHHANESRTFDIEKYHIDTHPSKKTLV